MGSFNAYCYLTNENYEKGELCHIFRLEKTGDAWLCSGYATGPYNDYGRIGKKEYIEHYGEEIDEDGELNGRFIHLSETGFQYAKNIKPSEISHMSLRVKIDFVSEIPEHIRIVLITSIKISGDQFIHSSLICSGGQPSCSKEAIADLRKVVKIYRFAKIKKKERPITSCGLSGAPIYEGESFKQLIFTYLTRDADRFEYLINCLDCTISEGRIIENKALTDNKLRGAGEIDDYYSYITVNIKDVFFDNLSLNLSEEDLSSITIPQREEWFYKNRLYGVQVGEKIFELPNYSLSFTSLRRLWDATEDELKIIVKEYVRYNAFRYMFNITVDHRDLLKFTTSTDQMTAKPVSLFRLKKKILKNAISKIRKTALKYGLF